MQQQHEKQGVERLHPISLPGVPESTIAAHRRWKSLAYRTYFDVQHSLELRLAATAPLRIRVIARYRPASSFLVCLRLRRSSTSFPHLDVHLAFPSCLVAALPAVVGHTNLSQLHRDAENSRLTACVQWRDIGVTGVHVITHGGDMMNSLIYHFSRGERSSVPTPFVKQRANLLLTKGSILCKQRVHISIAAPATSTTLLPAPLLHHCPTRRATRHTNYCTEHTLIEPAIPIPCHSGLHSVS